MMSDAAFLTPEMLAMLINNGLGGVAVILLFRVNQHLAEMLRTDESHERRIASLEISRTMSIREKI